MKKTARCGAKEAVFFEPDMWRTWKEKSLLLNRFTLNIFDNQFDLILFDSSR